MEMLAIRRNLLELQIDIEMWNWFKCFQDGSKCESDIQFQTFNLSLREDGQTSPSDHNSLIDTNYTNYAMDSNDIISVKEISHQRGRFKTVSEAQSMND